MAFIKKIRIIILIAAVVCVAACDDDLNSVGESIQPGEDGIQLKVDEVYLKAETVPLDRIYVKTETPLLGSLDDPSNPTYQHLEADYLAQLFTSGSAVFEENEKAVSDISIDSVLLNLSFLLDGFTGDSVSPMIVSAYQVNNELEANYYTNINPAKYCDKSILLGQRFFNIRSIPTVSFGSDASGRPILGRTLKVELDKNMGRQLLADWKNDKSILSSFEDFKEYFKGIYVTGNFNKKGIIEVLQTDLNVHYSYKVRKKDNSADSTLHRTLPFPVTNDGILINRAVNSGTGATPPNADRSYIKAPGAAGTKITIDLAEIKAKAKEKTNSDKYLINLAKFKLTGMTEVENELVLKKRPASLLFVNMDSITPSSLNFSRKNVLDGATGIVLKRDPYNNTYNFAVGNSYTTDGAYPPSSSFSNNLAAMINYYIKQDSLKEKLEFLVIPVLTDESPSSSSYYGYSITGVANLYNPSVAILRTEKDYMKMSLIFSKHNTSKTTNKNKE